MARKKHSEEEIAAKLAQATQMAAQGKLQSDIARALGVSVMTLHRWRHTPAARRFAAVATDRMGGDDQSKRISELQIENLRLRQLVTDLLLEKMKLEEASNGPKSPTRRASR